jgi:4'-phosphopantetheinyl transferase
MAVRGSDAHRSRMSVRNAEPTRAQCTSGRATQAVRPILCGVANRVGHTPTPGTGQMAGETIELYIGLLDAIDTPQACEACLATLSWEEKRRAARFVRDRHQRQYIFAHGLLRLALSNVAPEVEPSGWCFTTDRYGRPFVAAPATGRTVHFSLSHTDGCVACVVSGHQAVGVDVERIQKRGSLLETARSVFSLEEIEALRHLAPDELVDRFFDYWTLKEAYLKATGRGLSLPLDQFSMLISAEEIGIRFLPSIADDSRRWRFTRYSASPFHRLAVADGSGAAGGLPIMVRSWPLPVAASRLHQSCSLPFGPTFGSIES